MNLEPLAASAQAPKKPIGFDPEAFTRALRISGAVLVVAAASTFMLQNWVSSGNDLARYAMLVAQPVLLAAMAWFVALSVRESRSARTLLALVLATIPACFTVLGALFYSQVHPWEQLSRLPSYVSWLAPSVTAAVLAIALSLLVLVPLSLVSFVALSRKRAMALSLCFLGSNALLLIPARIPDLMISLAGATLVGLLAFDQSRLSRTSQLDTLEGRLARVMPFVAPLIVIGRAVYLYQVRLPFVGGLCLVAAGMFWQMLPRLKQPVNRDLGALSVAGLSGGGWILCCIAWSEHIHSASMQVMLFGLPAAAMLLASSLRAELLRKLLSSAAAIIGLGTTIVGCAAGLNTLSALVCILFGTLVAVSSAATRSRFWTLCGAMVALYGVGSQVWLAVREENTLRWAILTVMGLGLILGAAYVERNRPHVERLWDRLQQRRFQSAEPEPQSLEKAA